MPSAAQRSQSLDRNGDLSAAVFARRTRTASECSSISSHPEESKQGVEATASSTAASSKTAPSQPSPPSSDTRGEVEGSSDNNSPPNSVIQGNGNDVLHRRVDWLHDDVSKTNGVSDVSKANNGFNSLEEELLFLRTLRR